MNWIKSFLGIRDANQSRTDYPYTERAANSVYCAAWNMFLAQYTHNKLGRERGSQVFLHASQLLMRNGLKAVDTPQNSSDPEEDAIDYMAKSIGVDIPLRIREVGTPVFWIFMAKAMQELNIQPNLGKPTGIRWHSISSVPQILLDCDNISENIVIQVVNDISTYFGLKMPQFGE